MVASLLNPRSSAMALFEVITILNGKLTGNRLDANVGSKSWQKTIPKMTKLAPFLHKLSISWPLTDFGKSSELGHFTNGVGYT